ncbi:MAG TPA: hypothetical protein VFB06_25055 [Streptosporangiaceae bacterium]|nr:hypothetical protein [Streptosporangiaceae bacterium]
MPKKSLIDFLVLLKSDRTRFATYDTRNLAQFIFHAQNEGFEFTKADIDQVIGKLEVDAVTVKDHEEFGASSALWHDMWGCRRLDYLINRLLPRFTDSELAAVSTDDTQEWS